MLWHWLQQGTGRLDIVPIGRPTLGDDPRLQLLKKQSGVKLWDIQELLPAKVYKKYCAYWRYGGEEGVLRARRAFHKHLLRSPVKYGPVLESMAEPLLSKLLENRKGSTLILDWAADVDDRSAFDQRVHQLKDQYGFTTVAMPHGDEPHFTSLSMTSCKLLDPFASCISYDHSAKFDYVVAPNEACAQRFRTSLEETRLKVLGSARFSQQWMEEGIPQVMPELPVGLPKQPLVVMFLRNPWYPLFWDEVVRTFELLSHLPNAHLVVQHHLTDFGSWKLLLKYPQLKTGFHGSYTIDNGKIPSSWLTRNAAAVIDLGTSISFECVRLGTTVISPEYLHATQTMISHLMPSTQVFDREGLYSEIERSIVEPGCPNYTEFERQRFITEMLDVPDGRVLERHTNFLQGCDQELRKVA